MISLVLLSSGRWLSNTRVTLIHKEQTSLISGTLKPFTGDMVEVGRCFPGHQVDTTTVVVVPMVTPE